MDFNPSHASTMLDLNIDMSDIQLAPPQPKGKKKYLLTYVESGVFALQTDNSSLEVMLTCPRKYLYQVVFGRQTGPAAPLTYGSAIHEALDIWYSTPDRKAHDEALWIKMCQGAAEAWDNNYPPTEWRTLDRAIDTLSKYREQYPSEPFNVLAAEQAFSVPLGELDLGNTGLPFTWSQLVEPSSWPQEDIGDLKVNINKLLVFWTGKIDLVTEENNRLWIWDHKTSSVLGQSYFDQFELAQQTLGYTWAGNQIEDQPIFGFGLNVIVSRKPTRTGTGNEFHRRKFIYPKERVDEFPHNTMRIMETLVSYLIKDDFPKHSSWCVSKYMQKCPYFDVCAAASQDRGTILFSDNYVDNTWSPLDKS